MDRRQRLDDPTTNMEALKRAAQASIWTALPGIIQSFDAEKMTCEVQPSIQGIKVDFGTSAMTMVNLPLLVDCPVCFSGWGGVTLTLPIAPGDECLIIFASRCIDAWWQNGGIQPPMEYRMHDLSDGFVLPGGRSQPRVLSGLSTTTAQLRSDDGLVYIEVDPISHAINLVAPGGINITGPINLGGPDGQGVARIGDAVSGGIITGGSTTVKAA